ncbi:AMP deaminase putative / myoadenylate deaminase putative [Euphorbia peplus]|nr:AMP deaminase putative / myoadenylate deaminase putative [Euphorbia peplus]
MPKRSGSIIRPTSPKSPIASASAFESIEGSDEEDNMTDSSKLDTSYLHTNRTVGGEHINSIPNGEQLPIPASSMI